MLGSMQTASPAARRGGWLLWIAAAIVLLSVPLVSFTEQPQAQADEPAAAKESAGQEGAGVRKSPEKEFLPVPTDVEKKLLDVLEQPTEMEFNEAPLQDVVDYLKDYHQIEIQLDIKSLEEAGVGSDTPITANLKKISLRAALALVLNRYELAWILRDEVLQITTAAMENKWLFTRTYPVGDLDDGADFKSVVEAITTTVYPQSWSKADGPASIVVVGKSHSMVVSQTRAAHDQVLSLLRSLRAAREWQAPPVASGPGELKSKK